MMPPKWSEEFLLQRLAEHRAWQEAEQERMAAEIIDEVSSIERPKIVRVIRHQFAKEVTQ